MSLGVLLVKLVTEDKVVLEAVLLEETQKRRGKSFLLSRRDLHDLLVLEYVAAVYALELKVTGYVGVKKKLHHFT